MTNDTVTEEQNDKPTITLHDIENAIRIIDTAAQRGAFRGAELSGVGQVRDNLAAFALASRPAVEDADADAEVDEEVDEVEEVDEEPKPKRNPRKTAAKRTSRAKKAE